MADRGRERRDGGAGLGELGVSKGDARGVFAADARSFAIEQVERPGDVQRGIAPKDGALSGGEVEIGGFVEDFGGFGDDEEAVGEAFGDPEKVEIAGTGEGLQVEGCPAAEVGGVAAEIDGDVPDVAGEDAHQLTLRPAELVVKAAEDSFAGAGLIVLGEAGRQTGGGEALRVEDLGEPAAVIAEALGPDSFDVAKRGLDNLHPTSF